MIMENFPDEKTEKRNLMNRQKRFQMLPIGAALIGLAGCTSLDRCVNSGYAYALSRGYPFVQTDYADLPPEEKCVIQQELAVIARDAEDPEVRKCAAGYLTDQTVLRDLGTAERDREVCDVIIARLTDQPALTAVAQSHPLSAARLAAAQKVADSAVAQQVYADVARREESAALRSTAVALLTDPAALAAVAQQDRDVEVRRAAAAKVSDQQVLAAIAKLDDNRRIREAAVEQLEDQTALAEVAKHENDPLIRRRAAAKVTGQAALAEVAMFANDSLICREAVEKVHDQTLLALIARKARDLEVRDNAIARLTDQAALVELAKSMNGWMVSETAVNRIADQKGLAEIVMHADSPIIRQAALEKISDQALLATIVREVTDWEFGRAAVNQISDQQLLAAIVTESARSRIRDAALAALTDQQLIASLARDAESAVIRTAAAKRLTPESCKMHLDDCLDRAGRSGALVVEGLYIGMPVFDFIVITRAKGIAVNHCTLDSGAKVNLLFFDRINRRKLTQLPEENFCAAFAEKYLGGPVIWERGEDEASLWRFWRDPRARLRISYHPEYGSLKLEVY